MKCLLISYKLYNLVLYFFDKIAFYDAVVIQDIAFFSYL